MQIPDELARRLVALRRHLGRSEAPVLDGAAVDEVVAHVGFAIPDDVLAYLAALGVTEEGGALSREVDFDSAVEDLGFEPVIARAAGAGTEGGGQAAHRLRRGGDQDDRRELRGGCSLMAWRVLGLRTSQC
jgi:hypothetical protein